MPMYQSWDYECQSEDCAHVWDDIVVKEEREDQPCPLCKSESKRLLASPVGWARSKERTGAQLKKRSKDHDKHRDVYPVMRTSTRFRFPSGLLARKWQYKGLRLPAQEWIGHAVNDIPEI